MTTERQKWQQAADRLTNLLDHADTSQLTAMEFDWAHLLRERFWEISNRMKPGADDD